MVGVRFPEEPIRHIRELLYAGTIALEVAALEDSGIVGCRMALAPMKWLGLRMPVRATCSSITVPVGDAILGRMLNVFGAPVEKNRYRGLCGNYDEALASKIRTEALKALSRTRVLCIGAGMNDALSDQGLSPEITFLPPAWGRVTSDIVTRLNEVRDGDVWNRIAVSPGFTRRAGNGQREPVMSPLLPVAPSLLSDPGKVGGQFRLMRQDEITNELMEIIIGFEALRKKLPAL